MKPYVILNAAMTLDGKIATKTGSSKISNQADLLRVHELRKEVDGIMVGINTVIADNPKLTAHKLPNASKEDNPLRVIVDSRFRTPMAAKVTNNDAPTLIAGANLYKNDFLLSDRYQYLKKRVDFFYSGEKQVNLKSLMHHLASERNVKTLMLEGGSTLNFSMLKEGLIDEIRICIGPMAVGGTEAKSLFGGDGFDNMEDAVPLKLKDSFTLGEDLILIYNVINK